MKCSISNSRGVKKDNEFWKLIQFSLKGSLSSSLHGPRPWASQRSRFCYSCLGIFFSHLSILQSIIGLDWLAGLVGNVFYCDSNTVATKWFVYAKALIEISLKRPLRSTLKVRIAEGHDVDVVVRYSWKPDICSSCQSLGHYTMLVLFGQMLFQFILLIGSHFPGPLPESRPCKFASSLLPIFPMMFLPQLVCLMRI